MNKGDRVRILRSQEPELVGKYATVLCCTSYRSVVIKIDGTYSHKHYEEWPTTADKLEILKARIIKVI